MYEPERHEGIFVTFDKYEDLLYKEIYSNSPADKCYVNLYHKDKYVARAYVWCDQELFGREYIVINHEVIYLDTIKTLVQPSTIIQHVCDEFKVTFDELQDKCRRREYVEPRNILFYILREEYGITLQAIGDMFLKNHATVINGKERVKGYMEFDKAYREKVKSLVLTVVDEKSELQIA